MTRVATLDELGPRLSFQTRVHIVSVLVLFSGDVHRRGRQVLLGRVSVRIRPLTSTRNHLQRLETRKVSRKCGRVCFFAPKKLGVFVSSHRMNREPFALTDGSGVNRTLVRLADERTRVKIEHALSLRKDRDRGTSAVELPALTMLTWSSVSLCGQ